MKSYEKLLLPLCGPQSGVVFVSWREVHRVSWRSRGPACTVNNIKLNSGQSKTLGTVKNLRGC